MDRKLSVQRKSTLSLPMSPVNEYRGGYITLSLPMSPVNKYHGGYIALLLECALSDISQTGRTRWGERLWVGARSLRQKHGEGPHVADEGVRRRVRR